MLGKSRKFDKVMALENNYPFKKQDKQKIAEVLQNELQYLLQRKQKQRAKKKRIKELEQQYYQKRKQLIQNHQQKTANSAQLKNQAMKKRLEKNKRQLQHASQINQKFHLQHNEQIEKGLEKRKQFYLCELPLKGATSTPKQTLRMNTITYRKSDQSNYNQMKYQRDQANSLRYMNMIDEKLRKALRNKQGLRKYSLNKKRQGDRHSSIQENIRSRSIIKEQETLETVYGTQSQIVQAHSKVKSLHEKHLQERRKSMKNKLQRVQLNIGYLESEKKQKDDQIQAKFNQTHGHTTSPRHGNNSNISSHRQRVYLNHIKLQSKNKQRNQKILQKHYEITIKNNIYKQKKDQILQSVKKLNPEHQA